MDIVQAAIITRNEEAHLEACLRSLRPLVDRIVVVDNSYTDHTLKIAKSLTPYANKSKGFGPDREFHFANARNEALAYCGKGWILSVDADERVEGCDLRGYLQGVGHSTFEVAITLNGEYARGQCLKRSGPLTAFVPRLFRNDGSRRWRYRVHETPWPFVPNKLPESVLRIVHERSTLRAGTVERNYVLLKRQLRDVWTPEWSNEDRLKTLLDLGGACRDRKDPFEAIGYLHGALHFLGETSQRSAYVHNQLAGCHFTLGLMDKSVQHAMAAWKLVPGYMEPLLVLIASLLRIEKYTEALPLIKAARSIEQPLRFIRGEDDERFERNWLDAAEAKGLAA